VRNNRTATSAQDYLAQLGDLVAELDRAAIDQLAERVFEAWRDDRQVIVFGNGGSASTASHYVTDFIKTAAVDGQRRLRAMCLTDNVPMLTAIANDFAYEETFEYALESHGRPGDIAIAISGSGTSPNIVRACELAKRAGLYLVALTGFDGGTIGGIADLHINVASQNYGPIEDLHMSIGHVVTQCLNARVAAEAKHA